MKASARLIYYDCLWYLSTLSFSFGRLTFVLPDLSIVGGATKAAARESLGPQHLSKLFQIRLILMPVRYTHLSISTIGMISIATSIYLPFNNELHAWSAHSISTQEKWN